MKKSDILADFVREALTAGRSRDEIRTALTEAGWVGSEITEALGAWAQGSFSPPVPHPRSYLTAREFFRHAVLLVALLTSATTLSLVLQTLIDMWFTPEGQDYGYWIKSDLRWFTATLIVFLPLFLFFDHRATAARKKDPGQRRSIARQWYVYLSAIAALGALLLDLVYVIYSFLEGDLDAEFVLKSLAVALVAGVVLVVLRSDLKGVSQDG